MAKIPKKVSITILIVIISMCIIPLFVTYGRSDYNNNIIRLADERTSTLDYRSYEYYSYRANILETIKWSIYSINGTKLTIIICDELNYNKFISDQSSFNSKIIANNDTDRVEGYFNIPYDGFWFLIIFNNDSTLEETLVKFNCELILNPIMFHIIPICLIIIIAIFYVTFSIIFHKKKIENNMVGVFFWFITVVIMYYLLFPSLVASAPFIK